MPRRNRQRPDTSRKKPVLSSAWMKCVLEDTSEPVTGETSGGGAMLALAGRECQHVRLLYRSQGSPKWRKSGSSESRVHHART